MKAQVDVVCCKSVGTDLSMLDIEDFITEICQLKKEVASLEAKLRERGDKPNREVCADHTTFHPSRDLLTDNRALSALVSRREEHNHG